MLDILGAVGLSTNQFALLLCITALVVILAYRPFVISIFDPLNMFIVATIADAILVFGLDWSLKVKWEFAIFAVCFWGGFALAGKIPQTTPVVRFEADALLELEIVLIIASAMIIVANLYMGFVSGFPLLSAIPSDAKVTSYTGGLGFIRYLDQGPYLFLCCGCTLLVVMGRPVKALFMLGICSAFVALSGSKGALLPLLFVQAFVVNHRGLGQSVKFALKLRKIALPSAGAALAVALAIVIRENGGLSNGLVFLAKRLLYFGDVILFYYPRQGAIPELAHVGAIDYIHYLFDPLLATFRILDYGSIRPPLGSIISNSDAGFGPNAQYFVRADVFFGPVRGVFYCVAIGYLSNMLRRQFFSFTTRNAVFFTFSLLLAVAAVNLPFESSLFVAIVADTGVFLFPIWCFARVATFSTALPQSV